MLVITNKLLTIGNIYRKKEPENYDESVAIVPDEIEKHLYL